MKKEGTASPLCLDHFCSSSFRFNIVDISEQGFIQRLWGNGSGLGQALSGPLDSVALPVSGKEGLFWKKNKIFRGKHSAVNRMDPFVSPWLLITAHPEFCLSWPPGLHKCLEKVSFLLGKERLPLFYGAEKLMGGKV